MSKYINLNTLHGIAEGLREIRQEKKKEEQEKKSTHAMLDGADTQFSRDFFVKKGKEGGKIGGKKSWSMLTDEEQKAQVERLRLSRKKFSTVKKKKDLRIEPPSDIM